VGLFFALLLFVLLFVLLLPLLLLLPSMLCLPRPKTASKLLLRRDWRGGNEGALGELQVDSAVCLEVVWLSRLKLLGLLWLLQLWLRSAVVVLPLCPSPPALAAEEAKDGT